jgi:hypothetical protein
MRSCSRCWAFLVAAAGLLGLAAGCGGPPTGNVSGAIKYKDKPLTAGVVTFINTDGKSWSGPIVDGKYSVDKAPVGEVKISVQVPTATTGRTADFIAKYPKEAKSAESYKKVEPVAIPPHFADPNTSNLKYTVVSGNQTHDLDLK